MFGKADIYTLTPSNISSGVEIEDVSKPRVDCQHAQPPLDIPSEVGRITTLGRARRVEQIRLLCVEVKPYQFGIPNVGRCHYLPAYVRCTWPNWQSGGNRRPMPGTGTRVREGKRENRKQDAITKDSQTDKQHMHEKSRGLGRE